LSLDEVDVFVLICCIVREQIQLGIRVDKLAAEAQALGSSANAHMQAMMHAIERRSLDAKVRGRMWESGSGRGSKKRVVAKVCGSESVWERG
jgi:hypothetical protein